jgi:two-component system nitrogen regulation sensor histidine kinase NtrY
MILPVKSLASFLKVLRWMLLFLLACLSLLLLFKDRFLHVDQSIYYSLVSNRIDKSIQDAEKKSQLVINKIRDGEVTFSQLNKVVSASPFYIFEGSNPVYWSNAEYIPNYKSIRSNYKWNYVSNSSGKYLIYKDTVIANRKMLEIFFLLELERTYPVENAFINSHTNRTYFNDLPVRIFTNTKYKNTHFVSVNNTYLCSYECISSGQDYLYGTITTTIFVLLIFCMWVYFICDIWLCKRATYKRITARITAFIVFRFILLELNLPEYF